jgi:hypothetical protein
MKSNGRDVRATPAGSRTGRDTLETTAGAADHRSPRAAWWNKIFRSAASAGLIAVGIGGEASGVAAENTSYRPAAAAPETWQAFAKQFQEQVEQRLAGDDDKARHFQDYLTRRSQHGDAPRLTVVLQTWVRADGKVDRVEFDGIDDPDAIDDLRALLIDRSVGAPPPEMLQPLHLRLSLRANDPPPLRN